MNMLYQYLNNQQPMQQMSSAPRFQNPIQMAQYIMRAMTNPAQFVKDQFPEVPAELRNDPNAVLNYIKQSRGITDYDIQQAQQNPGGYRRR